MPAEAKRVPGTLHGAPTSVLDEPEIPPQDPLDRAMRDVIREYAGNALITPDEALVRRELAVVVDAIRSALRGKPRDLRAPGVADRLGLLRELRSAVVSNWKPEDGSILPVMRAIEAAQSSLMMWGDDAAVTDVLHPFSRNLLREVAHLLRSPLGSIVMLTDTLLDAGSGTLSDRQTRQLDIIHRAALGVAAIMGDLLVLVSEQERSMAAIGFEVGETLETVGNVVRPVAESHGSELVVVTGVDGTRIGPAAGIGQALLGLALRTALKTRDGKVEIAAVPEGGDVRFSVRGSGTVEPPGDDPADLLRVLRLDADTGTWALSADGLGLEAARTLIESMGSELSASLESEELMLTFRLRLPTSE